MTYLHRLADEPPLRHEPEYYEDRYRDELYVSCAACGPDSEWPCDEAPQQLAPRDGDKAGTAGEPTERE